MLQFASRGRSSPRGAKPRLQHGLAAMGNQVSCFSKSQMLFQAIETGKQEVVQEVTSPGGTSQSPRGNLKLPPPPPVPIPLRCPLTLYVLH